MINLTNKEQLAIITSYLKGYQMALVASGQKTLEETAPSSRLLHNSLVSRLNLDEENVFFYKDIAALIEKIEFKSQIIKEKTKTK